MQLVLSDVVKRFRGATALQGVDLTVTGGMFGLLGPNGAGKTTLLRILAGVSRPTSGSVRIGGEEIRTEAQRRRVKTTLGYLPQELGLYPDLNPREFLDYVGLLKGMHDRRHRRERVEALLEQVGLTQVARRRIGALSGGMKRRLGIAQALLNDPRLVLVDEPTVGLDPEERTRFRMLLASLGADRTVVLSTHIVEDVAQTCPNLAVLDGGRMRYQGTTRALLAQAAGHVWTAPQPTPAVTVVSAGQGPDGTAYRVVGPQPSPHAAAVEPTLEDAYLWLVRHQVPAA